MKKPKDVTSLADRLMQAASTPLMPAPAVAIPAVPATQPREDFAPRPAAPQRKAPKRNSVSVFLRLSKSLYEQFDEEAVRRTKELGRGVTVQQVILDRLGELGA